MKWTFLTAFGIAVLCSELSLSSALTVLFAATMAACGVLAVTCPRKRDDDVFNAHVL